MSIEIHDVTKTFPQAKKPAIQKISLSLPRGKVIGVAGPDGAGKTTFLRLLACVMKPCSGTITIEGLDSVKQAEEVHAIVGYMPQKFGLYEDLSVMQNMNLYADLRGVLPEKKKEMFEKLLHFTRLEPFTKRLAGNLSGGMKQKLGLACALMGEPKLLILDEPSVGVDPLSREELWQMVKKLVQDDIPVIWSTTYLREVESCDYVLLFHEGSLLFQGIPSDLTNRMKGRVFALQNFGPSKRDAFLQTVNNLDLTDAVMEGNKIRVVTKGSEDIPSLLAKAALATGTTIEQENPRFEDMFIDSLGGIRKGSSPLEEMFDPIGGSEEEVVIAKNLTKKFGNFTAVDGVNFSVKKGEIFGLLGPNGAGKSTTFKMMCGLLSPTEGKAIVENTILEKAKSESRLQIGYMAQKFSLYGTLSVLQNLRFFSGIYNLQGKYRDKVVQNMIKVFGLEPYLNTTADLLPLGFKQRLALSCAVMHKPLVLFLDEPTSGVDPITRREFWSHIMCLAQKGVTIIVTTHFMDEAEYCDRIGLIYQSKIIELGKPELLKQKIATEKNPNPTLEQAFITLIAQYREESL